MPRIPNDQYFTPPALVWPLLNEIELSFDDLIFEPCAGDLAIASELACEVDEDLILTGDIDPELKDLDFLGFDAGDRHWWSNAFSDFRPDWVITNPPYKQPDCDAIIQNSWEFADKGVAMLLRLSYLEPCQNRAKFLKEAPLSNLIIFNPRPQFIPGKKATDSSTVAWFVWRKGWNDATQIAFCTDWNQ